MKTFGELKNTFSEILIEGILRKDEKMTNIFKAYLKLIKEDDRLKAQAVAYGNIETASYDDDKLIEAYITENVNLIKEFSNVEIRTANNKLEKLLESVKKIKVNYADDLKTLHKYIYTLTNSKYDVNNIIESRNAIGKYILANESKEVIKEGLVPTKMLASVSVRKFNDKYRDLSVTEKKLVKTLINSTDDEKAELYESTRTECLDLINSQLKESKNELKEKLLDVKERILESKFSLEDFNTGIIKLISLKQKLIK